MRFASFVSEEAELEVAIRQAALEVRAGLGGDEPDLLVVFVSPHYLEDYPEVVPTLRSYFPLAPLVGCTGGGVVGGGREVEHSPAVSLTGAVLPGVDVTLLHLDPSTCDAMAQDESAWRVLLAEERPGLADEPGEALNFVLLADPYSCETRALIDSLDQAFPAATKVGGLASGADAPGENALFVGSGVFPDGAALLVLRGDLTMDTIVAQGCRPIGSPLFVTSAVRNRILELDGRKPTEVLSDIFDELPEADRAIFRRSLFIGFAMTEGESHYEHGDFLIRNLVGVDADSGLLAVGEMVTAGQVVQFHLRDAEASAADLSGLLSSYQAAAATPVAGALMFSCLGRGLHLYGESDHDSRLIAEHLGPIPVGGFFCNGEIGPVRDKTFLHGYTSSIALFRQRSAVSDSDG